MSLKWHWLTTQRHPIHAFRSTETDAMWPDSKFREVPSVLFHSPMHHADIRFPKKVQLKSQFCLTLDFKPSEFFPFPVLCPLSVSLYVSQWGWPVRGRTTKCQLSLPATPYGTPHRQDTNCAAKMKWLWCVMEWNAMPVHTSPDGETEKERERERAMEEKWRRGRHTNTLNTHIRHAQTHARPHTPTMENICIGLCYPEAEEGILTFPLLQAKSDPWLLPPDWRLAAAAPDGERRKTRGGGAEEKREGHGVGKGES